MLTVAPHPFKVARYVQPVREGPTLLEMLRQAQPDPVLAYHAAILIGGDPIPREIWGRVRPRAGARVEIRVLPAGGGGGKNPLRMVLQLAVVAAAFYLGPIAAPGLASGLGISTAAASNLATGAISAIGMMLVNAIAPVRPPKVRGGDADPSYTISGSRNRLAPFEPVPVILGRHRLAPAYGARPYTEVIGADQYVRMLFVWGVGPLSIDEASLKIGETPVTDYDGVEIEHREGTAADAALTLYPDTVSEEKISVKLTQAGGWIERTSALEADELSVDISFPYGLYDVKSKGGTEPEFVTVEIEYRKVGNVTWLTPTFTAKTVDDDWVSGSAITFTHDRQAAIIHGFRWNVASRGQYEIRVRRTTEDDRGENPGDVVDETWWSALRSFTDEDPINSAVPVAKTALRIKATDQLNGAPDEFNGIVTTLGKDWNGSSWVDDQEITNPASLFRHVLQGAGIADPLADARLDLTRLESWHDFCSTNGFAFNMVRQSASSVWEALADVAAAGRAAPTLVDGKWSVVVEEPQPVPVSHISPRNSYGFRAEKAFIDLPHAWRVRFPNEDEGYRPDERRVYRDGYDASNATKFETLPMPGVTNADQIWKIGRFRIAQVLNQPERWTFGQDMEFLTYQRGDRVTITHDVLLVGLASGRIKSVTVDGSNNVTAVTLDEEITMEAGQSYGLLIRSIHDAATTQQITTAAGSFKTAEFTSAIPNVGGQPAISEGDLFGFGLLGAETDDASIISIRPGNDFQAEVTAVPYRPAIFDADTGEIPAFTTNLTPVGLIPAPVVRSVISDESAISLGPGQSLRTRIAIWFDPLDSSAFKGARVIVQGRKSATREPFFDMDVDAEDRGQVFVAGVQDGDTWDIRLRFDVEGRLPGPWAHVYNHTVVGQSTPPAGLSGLTISAFGGQALLRWDAPDAIDVAFGGEVRFRHSPALVGATWAQSTSIGNTAKASDRQASVPLKAGTYLARVFDQSGNPSEVIATVTTKQASVLAYAAATSIDEAPNFAGTHSQTGVDAGNLKLGGSTLIDSIADVDAVADWDSEGGIVSSGTYDFAAGFDLGSVTRVRLTARITAVGTNLLDQIDDRTALIDVWEDFDGDGDQSATDAWVEVRYTDDDPAGSPSWSAWERLDSAEFEARGFDLRAQLITSDPAYNILVSELGVDAEELA